MNSKHLRQMLLLCGLMILCVVAVSAQTSSLFYLKIVDDAGGHDSLIFGNNVNGSFGLDTALAEYSSPPPPPGFFAFFICPRSPVPADWGLGLIHKDLRDCPGSLPAVRKDSFYVSIKNDDASATSANVTLTWPDAAVVNAECDSMKMVVPGDPDIPSSGINMATQSSIVINTPYDPNGWNLGAPIFKVRIFKYDIKPPLTMGVRKESPLTPSSFALHQNFPNPFNPTTTMKFDIMKAGMTNIAVYNILGQKVSTLVSSQLTPGTYSVQWNGRSDDNQTVNSGIYFVRMNVSTEGQTSFSDVRKVVLMK